MTPRVLARVEARFDRAATVARTRRAVASLLHLPVPLTVPDDVPERADPSEC